MDFDTPLADGETRLVNIPIKAGSTYGMVDVVFHITSVNNSYNETSVPFTYITRCTVNKLPHKRVLWRIIPHCGANGVPLVWSLPRHLCASTPMMPWPLPYTKVTNSPLLQLTKTACLRTTRQLCLPYGVHEKQDCGIRRHEHV